MQSHRPIGLRLARPQSLLVAPSRLQSIGTLDSCLAVPSLSLRRTDTGRPGKARAVLRSSQSHHYESGPVYTPGSANGSCARAASCARHGNTGPHRRSSRESTTVMKPIAASLSARAMLKADRPPAHWQFRTGHPQARIGLSYQCRFWCYGRLKYDLSNSVYGQGRGASPFPCW